MIKLLEIIFRDSCTVRSVRSPVQLVGFRENGVRKGRLLTGKHDWVVKWDGQTFRCWRVIHQEVPE